MDLMNSVAVITGGASGLGEATARRFVSMGSKVSLFDLNDERGEKLAEELGDSAIFIKVDVTDEASVGEAVSKTIETFGRIDICCNYAGISIPQKTVGKEGRASLEYFKLVINISTVGSFNVLSQVAEKMAEQELNEWGSRGVIINTSSIASFDGQMGQAAYSAAKGGINSMTLPIARDLAYYGIRVNTIVPGLIETPIYDGTPPSFVERLQEQVLYPKRLGKADEIAHLAVFMVENEYLNAEVIRLDAGVRLQPK